MQGLRAREDFSFPGILVGFQTDLGNLTGGTSDYVNYTNANGIADAFLTQQQNNGYAVVKVTAFSGNSLLQSSLLGWWPLDLGQGLSSPDISGNNHIGTSTNVSWGSPSFATFFDGRYSYASSSGSASYMPQTLSAWVYDMQPSLPTQSPVIDSVMDIGGASLYLKNTYVCIAFNGLNSPFPSNALCSASPIQRNKWYFVAGSYSPSTTTESVFINGGTANTLSISGSLSGSPANTISIGACLYCSPPGNFFTGYIADTQAYTQPLPGNALSLLYQLGVGALPLGYMGDVGWWPLNGNANDYSGHNQNGGAIDTYPTPFNLTSFPNATAGPMEAAVFNGVGSRVDLGNSLILEPLRSLSISMWINASAAQPTAHPQLMSDNGSVGNQGYNLSFSSGELVFTVREFTQPYGGCTTNSGTAVVLDGKRHFVAGIYNGTAVSIYLDGTLYGSSPCTDNPINYSSPSNGLIGRGFNGLISNVQFYSTALTSYNITSMYLQGRTGFPSVLSNLTAWYPLDGDANDYSAYGDNGTATSVSYAANNAAVQNFLSSIGGYGEGFNGQSSYISTGLSFPSGSTQASFTVSTWIYTTGPCLKSVYYCGIIDADNGANGWGLMAGPTTADFWVQSGDDMLFSIPNRAWTNVVVTYNKTNSVANAYVNGVDVDANVALPALTLPLPYALEIGRARQKASGASFNGSIANLQLFGTVLNASQVFQLYKGQLPPTATAYVPLAWLP